MGGFPIPQADGSGETRIQLDGNSDNSLRGDGICRPSSAGESVVIKTKITLTSAQLLNLNATPVELIPAQGANTVIHLMGLFAHYKFGTVAYANLGGGGFFISINRPVGDFGFGMTAGNFVADTISDQIQSFTQTSAFFGPIADGNNQALKIAKENSELTLGNGTLDITVFYAVVDLT